MNAGKGKREMQIAGASITWLTLLLQLILIIKNRETSIAGTIVRFFSFFTILVNILVAVSFSALLNFFGEKWQHFFSKPSNFSAVTVYIVLVGIVYNSVLRWQWEVSGLQMPVDESLHFIMPLFVLVYWLLYIPKSVLHWKEALQWTLFPVAYCIYILIRGYFINIYPYPFMNVDKLGYPAVFLNCFYVTLVFLVVSLLMIGLSKTVKEKSSV